LTAMILCIACMSAQNVYVLNSHSQLEPVTRAITTGTKVSGKAYLAALGAKLKTSVVLDGKYAELILPLGANYFYIHTPKSIPIKSWKIVPLLSGKNNTREFPYASTGAYTGTYSKMEELPIRTEKISDEVYKVWPAETLIKGEYALIRLETGVPAEIYDFSVDPSLSPALQIPDNDLVLAQFGSEKSSSEYMEDNTNSFMLKSRQMASDVDVNIPMTKKVADNTFALIISNENYEDADNVNFALNDGDVFKQYLLMTIGVPERQIIHIKDGSLSKIKRALNRIQELAGTAGSNAKIIVHYSGHGINDEKTTESYILPVDGYPTDTSTAIKLSDLYSSLGKTKAQSLVLFIDACFSGSQKNGEMIVAARGAKRKIKEETPIGNLVVFAAAQGDQTAYTYDSKEHGMMTYFLLKKLQESKGDATLGELSEYIVDNVKRTSVLEKDKSQTPATQVAISNKNWKSQTLR
ncbi:MAG: caspase family protein, partial [Muribaculaceae bacterium]|nr:caspase family protein [Muribaculaceae bacterium]